MVQVPADTSVTELPETVQTPVVVEVKVTVRPEVAVAVSVTGPAVSGVSGGWVKLIVWDPLPTAKLCWSWGAAL